LTNPTAGHTSATGMGSDAQGLRDGDGLTSPSLTNLYEGLHGNGIMRLGDGAKGDSLRNSVVANTPGFIQIGSSQGEVKVYGGYCVLDGVLYKFANGPGSHETFIVGTTGAGANHSGDLPSVPSSNADVFIVVYLVGRSTPEAHLMYEMGTPAAPTSGTPLLPNRFLSSPSISGNTDLNHQTTVLGVIRYSMTGGAANVTASLGSPVIHDRRAFLRKSPLYLTPMTKGAIGNVDAANALTNPDSFFASPEEGDLTGSTFGAIWQTHREDVAGAKHGIILAALPKNLDTTPVTGTYVLGPDRLETITTSGNITFTFDEANIWVVTTDAARTINPTGTFSAGHVVDIYHKSGAHNLHFDSTVGGHGTTPINVNIGVGESARFVYDGDNWHQVIAAASSFPSSSGASGLVQLSNGAGGFTSDTTLSYDTAANELTVDGKLTVTGLIDPTGLELTPQATNPAAADAGVVDANTLWLDSGASNRLKQGASNVIRATDSVTELSDVSNAGSGIIISDAERTKLTGIETAATADQTDAEIRAAVEAATDSNVFTDADHTKLDGIATGATAYADSDAIAAVEGEATLDLTGQVTAAQDLRVDGMVYQQFKDLTTNLATGWHSIALIAGRSGGVASGGTGASEQRGIGTFLIRNTSSSDHQSLTFVASHLFGTSNANGISIEHSSLFANLGISGVRMKEKNTYDGAVLQIEISDATNDIEVFLINNFQESGWELIQAVDDATDPSTVSLGVGYSVGYSSFNLAAVTDVTPVATLGKSVNRLQVDGTTLNVNVASYDNKVGIGTATPATLLHVAGTIRQGVTSAVLVADANGDLAAASNLADQTYLAPGGAEGDTFTATGTSVGSWAGAAPTTIQEAIERIAAYVVTIPGAPPTIP